MGIRKFKNWKISFINELELDEMLNELYEKKYYNFKSDSDKPLILDVGALIGETVLYFKDLYPKSRIIAFEPSPRSFTLLQKNVVSNKLTSVQLVNAAVSVRKGKMKFYTSKNDNNPWGRGDSLKQNRFNNPKDSKIVEVRTVKLSEYIKGVVDLLKLDIEGAETEVLEEIQQKLKSIKQIILEYHGSRSNPDNNYFKIMTILKNNGFTTNVYLSRWKIPSIITTPIVLFLSIVKRDEYWLRIYAKR